MYEKLLKSKWMYIGLFTFYILGYIVFELYLEAYTKNIVFMLQWVILGIMAYLVLKTLDIQRYGGEEEYLIFIIFLLGVIIRLQRVYGVYWEYSQHDVTGDGGHIEYILYIALNKSLPKTNEYQFYHPPLHHLICALWIRINTYMNIPKIKAIEGLQYISAFYSSATMIIVYKIFKYIGLQKRNLVLCTSIVSLAPIFIRLASSINNDTLMILLVFNIILYLLYWSKEPNMKNIFILGMSLGLGMMTKASATLMAPTIGLIFLTKLIKRNDMNLNSLIKQFGVFLITAIPVGLWYPLRNWIKFKQPFNYVVRFKDTVEGFTGNYSVYDRFFSFPFYSKVIKSPWTTLGEDFNLPTYMIKSPITGQFEIFSNDNIISILCMLNGVLMLISCIATIYMVFKIGDKINEKIIFGVTWLVLFVSYIIFYIQYPFTFTMDFRYIVPTMLCGVAFIGMTSENLQNRSSLINSAIKVNQGLMVIFMILSMFAYGVFWW